jgi:predicted metal-dependent hydrolase
VLEELWLADRHGPNYAYHKGLIQLAGAFVHLQKNRLRPAIALFNLAAANLEKYPARHDGIDLAVVRELIADWKGAVEKDGFEVNPLNQRPPPQLALPSAR